MLAVAGGPDSQLATDSDYPCLSGRDRVHDSIACFLRKMALIHLSKIPSPVAVAKAFRATGCTCLNPLRAPMITTWERMCVLGRSVNLEAVLSEQTQE